MAKPVPELEIGKVYGKLTILKKDKKPDGRPGYLCKCECGKEKIFTYTNLEVKKFISCGCIKSTKYNLIGKKFNHITVLDYHHRSPGRTVYYTYKCDCGYVDTGTAQNIKKKFSCGCIKKPQDFSEYIGKIFNNLTIIKWIGKDNRGHNQFEYKCSCGKVGKISRQNIGVTVSCGCKRKWGAKAHLNYEEITQVMWDRVFLNAQKRKLPFEITKEYAWEVFIKQERRCVFTNAVLTMEGNPKKYGTDKGNASIDRIDSSKGYIEGNIQWVDKTVNICKWSMSSEEFVNMCKTVAKNFSK